MVGIHDRRREVPRHKERKKLCRTCGHRTVHVYDHGLNRFICSDHEINHRE